MYKKAAPLKCWWNWHQNIVCINVDEIEAWLVCNLVAIKSKKRGGAAVPNLFVLKTFKLQTCVPPERFFTWNIVQYRIRLEFHVPGLGTAVLKISSIIFFVLEEPEQKQTPHMSVATIKNKVHYSNQRTFLLWNRTKTKYSMICS